MHRASSIANAHRGALIADHRHVLVGAVAVDLEQAVLTRYEALARVPESALSVSPAVERVNASHTSITGHTPPVGTERVQPIMWRLTRPE